MSNISTKKILAYTLLPQFTPRFRGLMSGFHFIAFFLAQVYRSAGLLPKNHPYLMKTNIGRYGIVHVVAEAGLLMRRRHASIDQVIVYWVLMTGLVILAAQFFLLMSGVFVTAAHAAAVGDGIGVNTNFFITNDPANDLAFMLMDRVFGVPQLFNSCVSTGGNCLDSSLAANSYWANTARSSTQTMPWPTPFHYALQSCFQLYSVALLCIAALILCYFVGAIIAETAESGTPFGTRFNKVWAPFRLVVAMGLLIPIANGLNSAQYITLYAAKFGSGFATNGWALFVKTAVNGDTTLLGTKDSLIATPGAQPLNTLITFMALVSTCKQGYEGISKRDGDNPPLLIKALQINPAHKDMPVQPMSGDFEAMFKYADKGNIVIRFGDNTKDSKGNFIYTDDTANVSPICGEVVIPTTNVDAQQAPGSLEIMKEYALFLNLLWGDAQGQGIQLGNQVNAIYKTGYALTSRDLTGVHHDPESPLPTIEDMKAQYANYNQYLQTNVTNGVAYQIDSSVLQNSQQDLLRYGWGGAGIWYNRIAQINGSLIQAVYDLPAPTKMPKVMEDIQKANLQINHDTSGPNRYTPYGAKGQNVQYKNSADAEMGVVMAQAYEQWSAASSPLNVSSNIFIDAVNAIFGTTGLFNMRQNQDAGIHPLAQLVAIGRTILESAVRNLGAAGAAGLGGGLINIENAHLAGSVGMAVSGFLWSIALTGLSIGFVLYYIVPFLPFIYFFFAVGSWVKTIFEAMVGMPLWALAHLRIDGQGLPGDAAMGGYFLVLEIFLRPILIIFGMIGGILIFTAQATVLNQIWDLVTSNINGFDRTKAAALTETDQTAGGTMQYLRDSIDQLFFSVIYAVVIYMVATSSFKMVDQVPDYVLRWMGANVQTFSDKSGEHPAEHLVSASFGGTQTLTGNLDRVSPQNLGGAISRAGQSFQQRNA